MSGACVALIAALASAASIQASPQTLTLTGRVVAAPATTPVAGAVVETATSRTATDQNGQFALVVPAGSIRLSIAAAGFVTQQLEVVASAAHPALAIVLEPVPRVTEEVTVAARLTPDVTTAAAVALAPREVFAVAGALDNIFKVLQTLPGVSATEDFGSRLAVRGGGPDQNLTVMDGVEIHNPYRLFGLTSAFNPETIERFELTAGGFSPKYGDRLLSLLVVENRDGVRDRRVGGSVSLALTDANVVLEGALPRTGTGSWLFTARRTYYDLIANRLADTKLPTFTDVQAKVAWNARPGHRVSLLVLRSREETDASFGGTEFSDSLQVRNESSNDLAALSVASAFGARTTARTVVGWYSHGDALLVDGIARDQARRSNAPTDDAFDQSVFIFSRQLIVRDGSLRHELSVQASRRHLLQAGFEVHSLNTVWDWDILGDRNPNEANGSSIQGGTALPALLNSARTITRTGIWAVDRLELSPRVRLEPGVRIDRAGLAGKTTVSPRVSAEVVLAENLRLRSAAGRFTQSPGYEKMLQGDYFVDLTSTEAGSLESERSTHAVAGLERRWGTGNSVRVEGYLKTYRGLILGRLETEAEQAARVRQYDFPAALASSVPASAQITTVPANLGGGRAYGMDVFLERRGRGPLTRLTGWASYTWGIARIEAYGQAYPFDYDRRHALSAVGMYRWLKRLDLAATLRVASGFPYTPATGLRVASILAGRAGAGAQGSVVPAHDLAGRLIWTMDYGEVSNLNAGRLPVFARLDVRFTIHSASRSGRWQVYVEILNALNRRNAGDLTPVLDYDPLGDRPHLRYTSENGLPRLPSIGVRVRL